MSYKHKIILPLITFIVALTGYGLTLARTVTLVDSGELILSCSGWGVAHPPGFPLYSLLGFFFARLPVGSVALRVALMSAVFAALTAALVTLMTIELGEILRESLAGMKKAKASGRKAEKTSLPELVALPETWLTRTFALVLPVAVGLTGAFSLTLWFYGSVAEVYTLNLALLAAVWWVMLRWYRAYGQTSQAGTWTSAHWLWLGSALYGCALGVHHVTIVLTFPAFVVFVWWKAGMKYFRSREVVIAFGIGVATIVTVYACLPVAALRAPVMNWGNPATLERFLWHVTGKQYQVNLFSGGSELIGRELKTFAGLLWRQFTPLGLIFLPIGFWTLWKQNRHLLVLPVLVVLFDVAYSVNYEIAEDKDAYYLTTNLALWLVIGVGAQSLFHQILRRGQFFTVLASLFVVALPLVNFATHFHENNKSRYLIARAYVENALASVESGGLLLTLDWQLYSPYLYLRHEENFRRDATVVDVNLVRRSWYVEGYLKREYPDMMRACAAEAEAYLKDLALFEADQPYDNVSIQKNFIALINAFVKFHLPTHSAAMTFPMEPGVGEGLTWVPHGVTMRLLPEAAGRDAGILPAPELNLSGLTDGTVFVDEVAHKKVLPAYVTMLANRGKYLSLKGRNTEAYEQLKRVLALDPTFDRAYEFLGDIYLAQNMTKEAVEAYRTALQFNPGNMTVQQHLQSLSTGRNTPAP
ncbi:MAG: DUF2723 domain-containing protein [Blastocatellia bacterium]|nr:DUF2723 domain-containing protein [Blastocatellia bacterium]